MTTSQTEAPARQRIAKLMARVGLCSRRDAEAWIVDGRVTVNGEVLTSPAHDVGPDDAILVDDAPLPSVQKTRLFMFHKPRGLVTSDRDPEGRATVADHLHTHWPDGPRVVTIGRLDINTEGLLLLTNDGGLARLLELPKTGWVRRYRVRAKGETDQSVLDALRAGVTIDGTDYAGIEATLDRTQGANVWLTMGLREGKNREVKRVLEHIGLEVNRLIRLSFGPFQLGDLAEGAVEEVRTRVLRDQLGAALAAAAGVAFEDAAPSPASKPGARTTHGDDKPRTAGAERVNKGERPPRGREAPTRGGDRPLRRPRDSEPPPPAPIRERPLAGGRKHVSTLRAEQGEAAKRGPRRRTERSDVTDRHDRRVKVERRVAAAPAARLETTRARGERPERRDRGGAPGQRAASPSALAKRVRTARSGGYGTERDDAAPRRREGAAGRERPAGERKFDDRPRRDSAVPGRDRPGGERPGRDRPSGDRPSGERPRDAGPRTGRTFGEGGGRAAGDRERPRSDARPARTQGDRPARGAGRGETRGAPGGARRADRPGGDDRRREAGARSERPTSDRPFQDKPRRDKPRKEKPHRDEVGRDAPRRAGPGSGRPREKRFDGERSASRPERAPRGEGRGSAGSARDGEGGARRPTRRLDGTRPEGSRGAPRGGPRPGGGRGGPKGAPGGAPGRGKPRPKS